LAQAVLRTIETATWTTDTERSNTRKCPTATKIENVSASGTGKENAKETENVTETAIAMSAIGTTNQHPFTVVLGRFPSTSPSPRDFLALFTVPAVFLLITTATRHLRL
jgi:hypothetical protein